LKRNKAPYIKTSAYGNRERLSYLFESYGFYVPTLFIVTQVTQAVTSQQSGVVWVQTIPPLQDIVTERTLPTLGY